MSDPRPIGVFDSGVGGLTVLRELQLQLPHESTIYFGDLGHFPYGPRYQAQVRHFALNIIRFLETLDESFPYDAEPDAPPSQGRWRIHGVGLSEHVLRAVYHDNAARLIRF